MPPALPVKKILIVYQRDWGKKFGQFFIEKFQAGYPDCQIGVLTVKEQADQHFRKKNDLGKIAWYKFYDPVRDFSEEYLSGDDFNIETICRELNITSIWEVLHATRNHIKNYRKKFNYAFTPSLTDEELLITVKAYYKLIKDIDQNFAPDLIIVPNAVESFNIMLEHYARAKNILCREIAPTSVKGFYQYVDNKNQGGGIIEKKFKSNADYSQCRQQAIAYIEKFRKEFIIPECAYHDSSAFLKYTPLSIAKTAAKMGRAVLWNKKLPKGLHADQTIYSPWLIFRDYVLHIHYHNAVKRFKYDPMPEKFVYFPLQMQPELAIDVLAPYFTNQIEVARLIAMSLPPGYTLLVKDHPIMVGRRRPQYLKKLQAQPNIKLINYAIKTPQILEKSAGVIVSCGSIVFEAALTGIPVIQLGNLSSSFLLPNVTHETDLTKLEKIWPKILGKRFSGADYDEILIKYISLVMQYGIDTNYYEMWEQDKAGDMEPFWTRLMDELKEDSATDGKESRHANSNRG